MDFPTELQYTFEHFWIKVEGNTGTIGITEFAQQNLGPITHLKMPSVGSVISSGYIIGRIEGVKTGSDLYMVVTGKIIEVNSGLESNPGLLNSDPYSKGWIIKIHINDLSSMIGLLTADSYAALVRAEML